MLASSVGLLLPAALLALADAAAVDPKSPPKSPAVRVSGQTENYWLSDPPYCTKYRCCVQRCKEHGYPRCYCENKTTCMCTTDQVGLHGEVPWSAAQALQVIMNGQDNPFPQLNLNQLIDAVNNNGNDNPEGARVPGQGPIGK